MRLTVVRLPRRQVTKCVIAPSAILQQHGPFAVEREHLKHVGRHFTLPRRVAHRHANGDVRSLFDDFGRLEAATLPMTLFEKVDHLSAVPSGRRGAVESSAGDAEPLGTHGKQLAERARITLVECGERLLETIGPVGHDEKNTPQANDGCVSKVKLDVVSTLVTSATITCPECDVQTREDMPTDACLFFYNCPGCGGLLRPLAGDCCVFCSYADAVCPPKQVGGPNCC